MSVQKIIQESVNKNPLGLKEALEEELRARVALALETKMSESDDEDEDDEELDEVSKSTLGSYASKARAQRGTGKDREKGISMAVRKSTSSAENSYDRGPRVKANESFDLSDLTLEELEDFMISEDFDQLDEISKKTLASYVKKAGGAGKEGLAHAVKSQMSAADRGDRADYKKSQRQANNRSTGIQRAADKLAK